MHIPRLAPSSIGPFIFPWHNLEEDHNEKTRIETARILIKENKGTQFLFFD